MSEDEFMNHESFMSTLWVIRVIYRQFEYFIGTL